MGKAARVIKKYWAILWIVGVWFIFAHPYFLKGFVPFPSTYLVDFFSPWNNYYGLPVKNNAMPDVISQIYPWKKIAIDSWRSGQIPFWNPYQFTGNPLLANYQSGVFTPLNILFFILPFIDAWSLLILAQPLLAGLFTYLFMCELKVSKFGAIISSTAFMFSGFITVWMAYGTLAYAILYLPLLLYGIERFFNKQDKIGAAIIIISIPLSFFSGHFQTSLYFLLTGIAYSVFKIISKKSYRLLTPYSLLITVGIVLALPQLIPSIQFHQQTVRSELFQKDEVIPWNYLITMIAPDFFGNPVTRNDWFGHYAEWASFAGVIPLILALFVVIYNWKNTHVRFFSIVGLLVLLLAFPTPLLDLVVRLKIPVLSTSAASRIIVLFSFSVAILAGIGFDYIKSKQKKYLPYLVGWITIVVAIWLMLFTGTLIGVEDVDAEKLRVAKRNFILPTLMVLSGSGFFLSHYIVNKLIKNKGWQKKLLHITHYALLITISFDMLRFATKWMPFDPREYVYPQNNALSFIQKNTGNYRVFGNFGNEAQAPFGLYGIEGYDPLYINRYGEFIAAGGDGNISKPQRSVVLLNKNGKYTKRMLDLLGVRYILHSKGDGQNIWAFPFWEYPDSFAGAIWSDEKYEIYENTKAFPRAFLVYDYKIANSDQEIIDLMLDKNTDLSKVIILEESLSLTMQPFNHKSMKNTVQIAKYTPNEVEIEIQSTHPGLLFLSDNYYPGWNAYANGNKTKIYRANYTFRAVEVPAGKSTVRFAYENWYF